MKYLISLILICLLFALPVLAALEDFTGYTEVDPNNKITITSTKVDIANIDVSDVAYVYSDKTAGHFDGDFEFLFEQYQDSATTNGLAGFFVLANSVGTRFQQLAESHLSVWFYDEAGDLRVLLYEVDSGTPYNDGPTTADSIDTLYYYTFERDEAVGTFGTIYLRQYTDSGRTDLLNTLTVTLHTSKKDFQYIYPFQNDGQWPGNFYTAFVQNLDLQEAAPPVEDVITPSLIIFD